jgi:K+-transporting ATPase ATPase A chain
MGGSGWLQLVVLAAALLVGARVLGAYIARVFGGEPLREDRVFAPLERAIYRLTGVTPESEQRWTAYARSVLAFSAVSVLGLYLPPAHPGRALP